MKEKDKMLPSELPTEDEIKRMVDATNNPRDRALIMTLYETGGRIGEVGSLRIKNIEFKPDYASVNLKGKTGARRVPIVAAAPYLSMWVEHHPQKSNPSAPLWPRSSDGKPLTYPTLTKVLKIAADRVGLRKRITPHKLRHARATFLANKLTEAQMNALFGWKQGSDMPSTYVHPSGRDIDHTVLGIYGLKKEKEKEKETHKLAPKECPRCKQSNPATNSFCFKCGIALDMNAVMELEGQREKADNIMKKLLDDTEVRKLIEQKMVEIAKG